MSSTLAKSELAVVEWPTVKLSDVCQFKPPKSIPRETLSDDSPVSFVPMGDLGELTKHFEAQTVRPFREVVKGYTYFADGDVLCAKITPCFENGKLGIARNLENGVGLGSSEFVVMRPGERLLPEFLYYYLSRDMFREAGKAVMSGAVGHKRVPKEYFESLEIPLPPLDEQERIVAVLDQAFTALDRARSLIEANFKDTQALFDRCVSLQTQSADPSWIDGTLGTIYDVRDGTHDSPKYQEYGYPLITSKNLGRNGLNFEKVKFVSKKDFLQISKRSAVHAGDVLFAMIGTIGNAIVVDGEPEFAIKNVALFKTTNGRDGRFLRYLLNSSPVRERMLSEAKGTTQKFVGLGYLRDFPIRIPPTSAEPRVIAALESFDRNCEFALAQYGEQLSSIRELRKSLLNLAFSGQLI